MGALEIILVVVLLMAIFGGGWGYQRRDDWGRGPASGFGLVVLILVIVLLFRVRF